MFNFLLRIFERVFLCETAVPYICFHDDWHVIYLRYCGTAEHFMTMGSCPKAARTDLTNVPTNPKNKQSAHPNPSRSFTRM